jgi:endonuclease/exonuclease/phosphatase family metal-dependent hydrolase
VTRNAAALLITAALTTWLVACGGGGPQAADGPATQDDAAVAADGGADTAPTDGPVGDAPVVSPTLPEDLPDPLPSGAPNVTLATFNTGLAATIKGASQRLPVIIDAVKQLDADVLCLQEVWTTYTTPKDFAAEVATEFPYSFWHERRVTPMGAGLLVLSKHPIYRGRALVYATQEPGGFFDKAVLGVDVVTDDAYFHLICTHTSAPTDSTGPPLRLAQIDELNAFAATNGYGTGVLFALGDFNTGPDPTQSCTPTTTPACNEPDVTSYAKLLETYTDPNEGWGECTWCRAIAMPLQISASYSADPDQRIDHCLYQGLTAGTFKSRSLIFDATVSIQVGTLTLEHLSDHLGVSCTFGP